MNDALKNIVDVDRVIHEPARLLIVSILSAVDSADFLYLLNATGLTKGNLSSHLARLEKEGYATVDKKFVGKIPRTTYQLTPAGQTAFDTYRAQMKAAIT